MLALDTETTGVDLYHRAKPFFVTLCELGEDPEFFEWDVDPLTREPLIPKEDIREITTRLKVVDNWYDKGEESRLEHALILQNAKFDAKSLRTLGISFPWRMVHDTLIAGHLLASNRPHNLTDMVVQYLGRDIEPYELALKEAVLSARRVAARHFPEWQLAKEGVPGMPSAKGGSKKAAKGVESDTPWKFDMWLPRALLKAGYKQKDNEKKHDWSTVLANYSNADSFYTVNLWVVMLQELKRQDLWEIYLAGRTVAPIVSEMENHGVTVNRSHWEEISAKCIEERDTLGARCVNIAKRFDYELSLPKGSAVNGSLQRFCFETMKLQPVYNPKAKGINPCLDAKNAIPYYLATLDPHSREYKFISSLSEKRVRDTTLGQLENYERFWLPYGNDANWLVLHPSLNQTGTDTLRFSCSNPNEQNISKRKGFSTRYCFGPAPGREWWSLDAKNIELRIPFYESGEEEMILLFERPDDPPYFGSNHLLIAHVLWPAEFEACRDSKGELDGRIFKKLYADTLYQWTKNGNFAVQYGAINKADGTGTADRAYHQAGAQNKVEKRFTKLSALNKHWVWYADKYGYVETLPDRTVNPRRGYPLLCTRTEWGKILPTVPLNYHVQGTAMWWTRQAMVKVEQQLAQWRAEGFEAYIVMQVHDELVLDFPKRSDPRVDAEWEKHHKATFRRSNLWRIRKIQNIMATCGSDLIPAIPTPVGCEYHEDNWSEGITL